LATLQTCLNLVNTLDLAQMQTNAKEILDKAQKEAESKSLVKWDANNAITLETLEKMLEEEDSFEDLTTSSMSSSQGSVQYEPHNRSHIDIDLIEL
jgi:TRAP-type mannitol/chloroaromatic compound transport system substrate-binding protein